VLFSHDTEHALATVVALVNTAPATTGEEGLPDLDALTEFVAVNQISDVSDLNDADLEAARRLRDRFHGVFSAIDDRGTVVGLVNTIIGEARTTPHLTDHDDYDWHVHFFAPGARLHEHVAADCGIALAYVISANELDRLRFCEAPDCTRVLVDLSRNRCRRYCDSRTCGNRMHVAAYRARQKESAAS
jgi:CGNR zinc finger/Putative stress-induced transcription regulator